MMKIALDAMGGDFAPKATIEGALMAQKALPKDVQIILIGKEDVIKQELTLLQAPTDSFPIVHAPEVIEMGEHPTKALSQKTNSSIAIGFGMLKQGAADALCSAGNTGAMMVGSMFSVKPIEGILRPAIAGFIPKVDGRFGVIIDVGANADCKPEMLAQFAILGSIYAQHVFGWDKPKVGLMNLGEEEEKGSILTQAAHQQIKALGDKINFVGNVEGRDVFTTAADVIVCDGFTGNVILKMAESLYDIFHEKNFLDNFTKLFNYEAVGGSPILGVNGNVIIGHGISSPTAIKNMLNQARLQVEADIVGKIKKAYA